MPISKGPNQGRTGQLLSSLTCGRRDNRHFIGVLAGSAPAANTHILTVGAVGPSPDPVSTVQQRGLRSLTVDLVQEDQTDALAERPIWYNLSVTPEGGEEVKLFSLLFYILMFF